MVKSHADICKEEVIAVADHILGQLSGYISDHDFEFEDVDEDASIRNKGLICARALQVAITRFGSPYSNITINFDK